VCPATFKLVYCYCQIKLSHIAQRLDTLSICWYKWISNRAVRCCFSPKVFKLHREPQKRGNLFCQYLRQFINQFKRFQQSKSATNLQCDECFKSHHTL